MSQTTFFNQIKLNQHSAVVVNIENNLKNKLELSECPEALT